MGMTRAQSNRKLRQDELREYLRNQQHIVFVVEAAQKLENLSEELEQLQVTRIKHAADLRLALIKKYLPDLKSVEYQGFSERTLVIVKNLTGESSNDDDAEDDRNTAEAAG